MNFVTVVIEGLICALLVVPVVVACERGALFVKRKAAYQLRRFHTIRALNRRTRTRASGA